MGNCACKLSPCCACGPKASCGICTGEDGYVGCSPCCRCKPCQCCKCQDGFQCSKCCSCEVRDDNECCPCCQGCSVCDGCCRECACCIPCCWCFCCKRCCGAKSVDAEDLKKFRAEVLKSHNDTRKKHGAALLKRNKQLDKTAQQWATHLASSGDFTHSKNEYKGHRLGENIANKWSSAGADYNGQEVTEQWTKEEPQYDYLGDSKSLNAGHFTQVVWSGSKFVGIGKAKTTNGKCIVVVNYYPAGNIIGHFKENVLESKK